jgi:hypothetical protein
MTLGQLLHPVREPIKHVYFPESGMVSTLTVMKSGEQIETSGLLGGKCKVDLSGNFWQLLTTII